MFRKLIIASLALITACSYAPQASAVSLLNGQAHYYTVQLRSDAKAIVYAKLVFQNGSDDKDRDSFTFSLPDGVKVSNVSTQQIIAKSSTPTPCQRYETLEEYQKRTGTSISLPIYNAGNSMQKQCLLKGETTYDNDFNFTTGGQTYAYDYYSPSYLYVDNYEYADITPDIKDATYTLKLAHAIKPHKQGAVLVSFTSDSYAKTILGYSNYDFRTLKVDEMIDTANVAIAFDQELYSRDVTQKRVSETLVSDTSSSGAVSPTYKSDSLDRLASSIGQGGVYTRTQTRMIPGDVMKVSGVYASNAVLLYAKEILIALLVLAAFVVVLVRVLKKIKLRRPKIEATETKKTNAPSVNQDTSVHFGKMAIVSAASIGATIVAAVLFGGLLALTNRTEYGYNSGAADVVAAIYAIVVFGSTIFVAPLIWVLRDGLRQAFVWILVHTVSVAIVSYIAVIIISLLTTQPQTIGGPYPAVL